MSEIRTWRREYANEWPCARDCADRKQGCHSNCEKYKDAKKKNDARKAELRAKRDAEFAVKTYVAKRISEVSRTKIKER